MSDSQIINLNIGLNWTDGSDSGEFSPEHALFLLGVKFNFCLIETEPYVSSWDDGRRTYVDNCIAVRITVPESRDYSLGEIVGKVNSIRVILKQDAIAFDVWHSNDTRDSSVHYGDNPPNDALQFNPQCFRYVITT